MGISNFPWKLFQIYITGKPRNSAISNFSNIDAKNSLIRKVCLFWPTSKLLVKSGTKVTFGKNVRLGLQWIEDRPGTAKRCRNYIKIMCFQVWGSRRRDYAFFSRKFERVHFGPLSPRKLSFRYLAGRLQMAVMQPGNLFSILDVITIFLVSITAHPLNRGKFSPKFKLGYRNEFCHTACYIKRALLAVQLWREPQTKLIGVRTI